MGSSFGAICKACGHAYHVRSGDIRQAEQWRCEQCGDARYMPRAARRRAEHLETVMPADQRRAREAVEQGRATLRERAEAWCEGWRSWMPVAGLVVRRARAGLEALEAREAELTRAEDELLRTHPEPPMPACDCGGRLSRGAPIRCPACRSTEYERDPSVHELMVD